ncbi:MAG TPA: mannosyltransferase family protein [Acidimicrobiia bacterium]|nr:mannosyltransferase family protein [Acidimicrobiia bacterium]
MIERVRASRFVREDLRAAALPWIASRALVVGALLLSRFLFDEIGRAPRPIQLAQGLFAWDAAFYREIAEHGYAALSAESLRFFPLFPLVSRALGVVFLGHTDVAVIVVANLAALVFAALLHRLAVVETGDRALAVRAAWFGLLFPVAASLVFGYAEALVMTLAVGVFLALRTKRWAVAGALGLLAGATRPLGVLLALPALIEVLRGWSAIDLRARARRLVAVVGPPIGLGCFLTYSAIEFGDFLEPLSVQDHPQLRGGFQDPFTRVIDAARDLLDGDRLGSGSPLLWAILLTGLLVVVARRLPASYSWYAGATLVLGFTAKNLGSYERYAMSAFPFVLGIAFLTKRREVERTALVVSAAGLVAYSVLAFFGSWVP